MALYYQAVMLNKVKTSRPRPRQFLEVEARAETKNNYEKVPNLIMINNILR